MKKHKTVAILAALTAVFLTTAPAYACVPCGTGGSSGSTLTVDPKLLQEISNVGHQAETFIQSQTLVAEPSDIALLASAGAGLWFTLRRRGHA